jgi:FkbM family methyltransferase
MTATTVVIAAGRRLVQSQPRLATRLLRLPKVVPPRTLRSRLYRSLSWPLALRIHAETEVSVAGGNRMLVRTDDLIGRVLAISGVWEPNITAAFKRSLGPGDVCLDIGAHIGYYSLLAARVVGLQGHVYAFEPSPDCYRRLRANVDFNGLENVTAVELAVGEEEGRSVLYEPQGTNSGLSTLDPILAAKHLTPPREVTVDVGPVTSVVPAQDLARIRVIKIDVEWHELQVLRSLRPVFDAAGDLAVFLEWTPRRAAPGISEDLLALCQAQGFTIYVVPNGYSLERLIPDRLDEPAPLDGLPVKQTDLLLLR